MTTPVHTHVFASHTWKKTNGWKDRRKQGSVDIHKCPQCGSFKFTDRNTLRTAYLPATGDKTPPACVYDGSTADEMDKLKMKLPFFPEGWHIEQQKAYIDRTGHELPLRYPKRPLDELLSD